MGDLKKNYGTDTAAEMEGVWETLADGMEIKVARVGNENYDRVWERIMRPHKAALDRNPSHLGQQKQTDLLVRVMAEAVLLDWRNIELDGKKLPYNMDNCIKILTDYKDFRGDVLLIAQQMATFRVDEIEAAEKN